MYEMEDRTGDPGSEGPRAAGRARGRALREDHRCHGGGHRLPGRPARSLPGPRRRRPGDALGARRTQRHPRALRARVARAASGCRHPRGGGSWGGSISPSLQPPRRARRGDVGPRQPELPGTRRPLHHGPDEPAAHPGGGLPHRGGHTVPPLRRGRPRGPSRRQPRPVHQPPGERVAAACSPTHPRGWPT